MPVLRSFLVPFRCLPAEKGKRLIQAQSLAVRAGDFVGHRPFYDQDMTSCQ